MIPNYDNRQLADQLYQLAEGAGAKDPARVVAGIIMAVDRGEDAGEMLDSLRRNQPRLFYPVRPTNERKSAKKSRKDEGEHNRWV